MRPLTISLPDYLYEKLTQQAQAFETSLEELVLFQLKRDEARDAASAFLRKRAGRCLTVREPVFKETVPPLWVVPIFTNVAPPVEVGEIIVDADTGEVLSTQQDVVKMMKKGHVSFGFESFAIEKQERLAELLALNNERTLESNEKQEMETLLAEEQKLQIRNLETLEKRLLS
ncbi:hypothetical protein F4Y59_10810 [Candidatus Poribacteria bacterium]|nr:hypothetical protein [Candidatus Poribacteria bacterium]MXY28637.1 hypothetical protein [Candidatus Poribacteria bacterium]MYK17284.1 hypothetical protein [Candidatus Poribacteria bacterium]